MRPPPNRANVGAHFAIAFLLVASLVALVLVVAALRPQGEPGVLMRVFHGHDWENLESQTVRESLSFDPATNEPTRKTAF